MIVINLSRIKRYNDQELVLFRFEMLWVLLWNRSSTPKLENSAMHGMVHGAWFVAPWERNGGNTIKATAIIAYLILSALLQSIHHLKQSCCQKAWASTSSISSERAGKERTKSLRARITNKSQACRTWGCIRTDVYRLLQMQICPLLRTWLHSYAKKNWAS